MPALSTPQVRPSGLVTVAYLKARIDEGSDHLGMFLPLVFDAIGGVKTPTFSTSDIQELVAARHGLAMPQQTVSTLLKRAKRDGYIVRDAGRYRPCSHKKIKSLNVAAEKQAIELSQRRLGEELQKHAAKCHLELDDPNQALDLLFRFLEQEHVALLLGISLSLDQGMDQSRREKAIIAEFLHDVVREDTALRVALDAIIEGLVLYSAAFLPDLQATTRQFQGLKVFLDSGLVRQALGYEGSALQSLMRDTLDLLKAGGARCLVFDKTVHEIRRILQMYEQKLATDIGRRSLRSHPMARHFLQMHYSPSDVREMSALLEREIEGLSLAVQKMPERSLQYTSWEQGLTRRLVDSTTKDELEPRVVHDVDCVAAILTLRRSSRPVSLEDALAVFASDSQLVIRNTRRWFVEDENEGGIEPVVHIRALANLAWLKRPHLAREMKHRELVALCSAALRPRQETWARFLRHLESLEASKRLTSDEVTALLVSSMSDRLLREAEDDDDDPHDIDAVSLDEIVERVQESYGAKSLADRQELEHKHEAELAELKAVTEAAVARALAAERARVEEVDAERARAAMAEERRTAAERSTNLRIEARAATWAQRTCGGIYWLFVALVLAGAGVLVAGHPVHFGLIGSLVLAGILAFIGLELAGIFKHMKELRTQLEVRLTRRFRAWLAQSPPGED